MLDAGAPRSPESFDLVTRSMEEAEQVLRSVRDDNSKLTWGAAFATKEMAEVAAHELEIRKMWADLISPPGKFSALGDVEQLAREGFESILTSVIPGPDVLKSLQETMTAQEREMTAFLKTFHVPSISTDMLDTLNGRCREMERLATEYALRLSATETLAKDISAAFSFAETMQETFKKHAQSIALDHTLAMGPIRMTPMFPREREIIREKEIIREVKTNCFVLFVSGPSGTEHTPFETTKQDVFVRRGRIWFVGIDGDIKPMTHQKGFEYIGYTMARPGQLLIHVDVVDDLARRDVFEQTVSDDEVIDQKTRREVQCRYDKLNTELRRAEENGQIERIREYRDEIRKLGDYLEASLGLGGRPRLVSDRVKRARESVTKAIERSLKTLRTDHPAIYQHLQENLRLTPLLSYQQSTPRDWDLGSL